MADTFLSLKGTISTPHTMKGKLSNATLRGMPVEIRLTDDFILQWKYLDEDEWRDLLDLSEINYEALGNLPQINGVELLGNKTAADLGLSTQSQGVTTITRNGLTFTVTRPDGTSFTVDQMDTTYDEASSSSAGLMSASDKSKLDGVESGSQANIIESIKVNSVAQIVDNKAVNITVPLVDDELTETGQAADAKITGDAFLALGESLSQTASSIRGELAGKEDALVYTATSEDVGKAMMPKTVANGKVTEWEFGEAGKVDDVQVNGMSIIENKVANIPIASETALGVAKAGRGLVNESGTFRITSAAPNLIKAGVENYRPIVPTNQHESAFYGLAKAAGDTTQSQSENTVGTYTDAAKQAIQAMLGIDTAISDAVGQITGFDFEVVQALPVTGETGIIYLVPKSTAEDNSSSTGPIVGSATVGDAVLGQNDNIYYEYIWVTDRFEKIGNTELNLNGYLKETDIASNASVNTMLAKVFS